MSCRSRSWISCSGESGDVRIVRHAVVQIVGFPFAEQILSWSESLSWSERSFYGRVSVGLRRAMNGEVLCIVFPSVLDSQNARQRWCQVRRRIAGDDPRTDQNDDGKGVKRAEVPPAENFPGCPGGCLSAWSSVCVSGSWSCGCLFLPGAGRWVSVSGALFPRGWLLPLSSWFRLLCWLS